eukprot:COSAG01_NODE_1582_length_9827_cov_6.684108_1_plen_67_part_10
MLSLNGGEGRQIDLTLPVNAEAIYILDVKARCVERTGPITSSQETTSAPVRSRPRCSHSCCCSRNRG